MPTNANVRSALDQKGESVFHVAPETPVYEALEVIAHHDIGAPCLSFRGSSW